MFVLEAFHLCKYINKECPHSFFESEPNYILLIFFIEGDDFNNWHSCYNDISSVLLKYDKYNIKIHLKKRKKKQQPNQIVAKKKHSIFRHYNLFPSHKEMH